MNRLHGAQLRLRAMAALGWSTWDIAERFGLPDYLVGQIVTGTLPTVPDLIARRITAVYDRTSMTLPLGDVAQANGLRRHALALGWIPPLGLDDDQIDNPDWIHGQADDADPDEFEPFDEAAVLRRLSGDRSSHITKADRIEIVRRGRRRGMSYSDIEHVCGLTKVERYIEHLVAS